MKSDKDARKIAWRVFRRAIVWKIRGSYAIEELVPARRFPLIRCEGLRSGKDSEAQDSEQHREQSEFVHGDSVTGKLAHRDCRERRRRRGVSGACAPRRRDKLALVSSQFCVELGGRGRQCFRCNCNPRVTFHSTSNCATSSAPWSIRATCAPATASQRAASWPGNSACTAPRWRMRMPNWSPKG